MLISSVMKIVRFLLSIVVICVSGYLMFQDFSTREFMTFTITKEESGPDALELMKKNRLLDNWITGRLVNQSLNFNAEENEVTVTGDQEDEPVIDAIVAEWNLQEKGEEEKRHQKLKTEKMRLQQESEELKREIGQLENWLQQMKTLALKPVSFKKSSKNPLKPKENASETEPIRNVGQINEEPVILRDSPTADESLDATHLLEVAESRLQSLEENQQRFEERQKSLFKSVLQEMQAQSMDHVSQVAEQLSLQMTQERNWLKQQQMQYATLLKSRLASVEKKQTVLLQELEAKPKVSTLTLSLEKVSAQPRAAQLIPSFKILMLGFLACFLINLVWEFIAQRQKI